MGALKAIKINQNDGRAVFLCLPKTKYRVTKGFKFHARPQTGAYSCLFYPVYWRIQFCTSILNILHEPSHAAGLIGDSDCDFEFGNCGYVQEYVTDDFDWVLNQGSTSTWGTGPATDHSTESMEGKTHTPCSFLSKDFLQSHMAIETINYTEPMITMYVDKPTLALNPSLPPPTAPPYRLPPSSPPHPTPLPTVPPYPLPPLPTAPPNPLPPLPTAPPYRPSLTPLPTAPPYHPSLPPLPTAPPYRHSLPPPYPLPTPFLTTGHYMYIESSGTFNATTATLMGPWMTTQDPDCDLVFWYHMNGAHIGALNVKLTQVTVLCMILQLCANFSCFQTAKTSTSVLAFLDLILRS